MSDPGKEIAGLNYDAQQAMSRAIGLDPKFVRAIQLRVDADDGALCIVTVEIFLTVEQMRALGLAIAGGAK